MTPALEKHEPRSLEQTIETYRNAAQYHAHNGRKKMAQEYREKAERLQKQLDMTNATVNK